MHMRIMIFLFSFFVLIHCSKESKDIASEFALTEEDKAAALQIHNNARTDVGVPPLTWSEALANDAAAWAKNMASRDQMYHSQNNSREGQGENLYMTTATDREHSGRNASQAWYEEIQLYTYAPINSGANDFAAIGHYTQMIWKNTTEVGMALAVSKSGATYVVARYSPPGNFVGETPY